MRFHHVMAIILILVVCIAYTLFLADQITRIRIQHAVGLPFGEFRP